MKMQGLFIFFFQALMVWISSALYAQAFLDVNLPPGFKIEVFMENVPGIRSLTQAAPGIFYAGTRAKSVYRLSDKGGDGIPDRLEHIFRDLNMPNGVAMKGRDLYIAEVHRILKVRDVEKNYASPTIEIVFDKLPSDRHHGWKFIAFGPDERLYIPIGAPCNICDPKLPYASIYRFDLNSKVFELVARGVRNSVGFDWDPLTKEFWFSDNGRDMMGDQLPPCEINHLTQLGQDFGYPFCHGGIYQDPDFRKRPCGGFVSPAQNLAPHVAPLGIHFYRGNMFPKKYHNQLFVAEHGSWNRADPIGYRISLITLNKDRVSTSYETFLDGWLRNGKPSARPVAFLELKDGSLLVTDDHGGRIFRISYGASRALKLP